MWNFIGFTKPFNLHPRAASHNSVLRSREDHCFSNVVIGFKFLMWTYCADPADAEAFLTAVRTMLFQLALFNGVGNKEFPLRSRYFVQIAWYGSQQFTLPSSTFVGRSIGLEFAFRMWFLSGLNFSLGTLFGVRYPDFQRTVEKRLVV